MSPLLPPRAPSFDVRWDELDARFDWIAALRGCPQDPIHHAEGDVWVHTRMVAEAMAASSRWRALPDARREALFAAALLHDVAKPATTRDEDGRIGITVQSDAFAAGVRELVAKLKTFRFEGERRLRLIADYAQSNECRSVFIRRYFGEAHPPRCGTCDRCRAGRADAPTDDRQPRKRRRRHARRQRNRPSPAAENPQH